jgi:hypothetical protein
VACDHQVNAVQTLPAKNSVAVFDDHKSAVKGKAYFRVMLDLTTSGNQ